MEVIKDFWGIIMAGIGVLVWLVRLEGATKANTTELQRQREQRGEDLRVTATSRHETNELLAEIRSDVKVLMQKGGR